MAIKAQVYSAVRVVEPSLERHKQIGVFLGPAIVDGKEVEGESTVKFESEVPGGAQVIETFEDAWLEPVV